MAQSIPKVIVRDFGTKLTEFVAVAQDGKRGLWHEVKVTHDFERFTQRTMLMATLKDPATCHGPVAISGDDVLSAGDDLPLSPCKLSHDPVPDQDVCLACEEVEVRRLLGLGNGRRYQLGDAGGVLSCTNCALCRILTNAFEIDSMKSVDEMIRAYSHCSVILTSISSTFPKGSRHDRNYEIWARLRDPTNAIIHASARIRLLSDDAAIINKSSLFNGRAVQSTRADMRLTRSWLAECEGSHDCSQSAHQGGSHNEETMLVVDVEEYCLREIPNRSRYLTLSYVWPRIVSLPLEERRLEDFMKPGAFLEFGTALANVLQDAISVVRLLGERYIWIDVLCVPQDNAEKKDRLIRMMHLIYGNSVLNIIVATSASPHENYSIPGVREPRVSRQHTEVIEGLRFVTALPDYNVALERSWWATRGWTFQEGILSPRCLIFTDDQIYFRCIKDSRCEDVHAESDKMYEAHPAKPMVRQSGVDYLLNPAFFGNISKDDSFKEYSLLVRDFSKRSLTYESDILLAFTGILQTLGVYTRTWGYFYGLPCSSFDRAMLWYPTSVARRRQAEVSKGSGIMYPTWCWAGWVGSVDYELDILRLGDTNSVLPTNEWYRFQEGRLIPVWYQSDQRKETPDFALGLLYAHAPVMRNNPAAIIAWVSSVKRRLDLHEHHLMDWVTDFDQSVPCFTILDLDGDACGYLPSADRAWARMYKERQGGECEMIILSHSQQSDGDEFRTRMKSIHPKYHVVGNPLVCFYNVMLVEYDDKSGIAYRRGIGRIHKDAVHENRDSYVDRKIVILG